MGGLGVIEVRALALTDGMVAMPGLAHSERRVGQVEGGLVHSERRVVHVGVRHGGRLGIREVERLLVMDPSVGVVHVSRVRRLLGRQAHRPEVGKHGLRVVFRRRVTAQRRLVQGITGFGVTHAEAPCLVVQGVVRILLVLGLA